MVKVFISGISACLVAAYAVLGFAQEQNAKVRFGLNADPAYTPYFVAVSEGLFKKHRIDADVKFFTASPDIADSVAAGEIDFGGAGTATWIARAPTGNVVLLGTTATSGTTFKMVTRSDMSKPADFIGKRLGVVGGSGPAYVWGLFLKQNNIPVDKVTMVNAAPGELVAGLDRGFVDAIYIWEPWPKKALEISGSKVKVFQTSADVGYLLYFDIAGNTKFVRSNAETTVKVLSALQDAIKFINDNFEKAVGITADQIKQRPEQVRPLMQEYKYELSMPAGLKDDFKNASAWLMSIGRLKQAPDPEKSIDDSYVRRVTPK